MNERNETRKVNHPLYMSHLTLAEYVNWEMSAAPVL